MRKLVAPVLSILALSLVVSGCSVKVQAGTPDEPKPAVAKPAPKPAAAPKPKKPRLNLKGLRKVGNELELPAPVPFKTGSAELDTEAGADEILELVRQYLVANPDTTLLRIEGHTDSDGDDAFLYMRIASTSSLHFSPRRHVTQKLENHQTAITSWGP